MIGIFDSGFGGLSILKEFRKILGEYDYIYYGDSKNAPYGDKSSEQIRDLTESGINFLLNRGATMVILACNTATVNITHFQQNIFPSKKILGITIPGAEKVAELGYKKVGVLATSSTVDHGLYKERINRIDENVNVQQIAAPKLVPFIEKGMHRVPEFKVILKEYLNLFDDDIEGLVIGCTHYSLIINEIKDLIQSNLRIIDPSYESALKLKNYLIRHKDIENDLSKNGNLKIFTSGDYNEFIRIGTQFLK